MVCYNANHFEETPAGLSPKANQSFRKVASATFAGTRVNVTSASTTVILTGTLTWSNTTGVNMRIMPIFSLGTQKIASTSNTQIFLEKRYDYTVNGAAPVLATISFFGGVTSLGTNSAGTYSGYSIFSVTEVDEPKKSINLLTSAKTSVPAAGLFRFSFDVRLYVPVFDAVGVPPSFSSEIENWAEIEDFSLDLYAWAA